MKRSSEQDYIRFTLAGLQAGCLGAIAMIGFWLFGSSTQHRSPWTVPNLLATLFYGISIRRSGFSIPTLAGLALPFVAYSILAVIFAALVRDRVGGPLLAILGILSGIAADLFFFRVGLTSLDPLIQPYLPKDTILLSHVVYGACLATAPKFARRLLHHEQLNQEVSGRVP